MTHYGGAHIMQIDLTQKLVVLAPNRQYLIDEARNYGLTGMEDMFILVTNATEANAVFNSELSRDTPWCTIALPMAADLFAWVRSAIQTVAVPGTENDATPHPINYFHPAVNFAQALRMHTVETAIHPRKLRGGGSGYERP